MIDKTMHAIIYQIILYCIAIHNLIAWLIKSLIYMAIVAFFTLMLFSVIFSGAYLFIGKQSYN